MALTAGVVVACLLLGGATRSGFVADALLQLLSVPLLLMALWRLSPRPARLNGVLAFCVVLVLVPIVQLIPLPPEVWTRLPLRDLVARSLSLAGVDPGWRPLSLTPHGTWLSLCALIPPLAVFLAMLHLSWAERRRLVLLLLALGVASSAVGLLQVAQGPRGTPIGFGLGTPGEATGFLANRNHFAALLYSLLLFAAVFSIDSSKTLSSPTAKTWDTRPLILGVLSFAVVVVLLAGEIMARSRAGLGLTIVALFGIAALASSDARGHEGRGTKRLIGGAVALVLIFASQFALYRLLERFEADPLQDARLTFARNTWDAAWTLMPAGSGLGSFIPVYQFFEKPGDALVDVYANRAHNDILEVWLETGVVGPVLMAIFAGWLALRFWQVWRPRGNAAAFGARQPLDQLLMRAASLIVVLLIAHSFVDYPLRTTALAVIFAVACGLLLAPIPGPGRGTPEFGQDAEEEAVPGDRGWEAAPRPKSQAGAHGSPHPQRERSASAPQERVMPSLSQPDRAPRGAEAEEGASDRPQPPAQAARWAWPDQPAAEPPSPSGPPATAPHPGPTTRPNPSNTSQRWGADIAWPEAWRQPSGPAKGTPKSDPSDTE